MSKIITIIFYPFLFVIYLIFNLLSWNLSEFAILQSLRTLTILLISCSCLLFLIYTINKNWHRSGYLVFLLFAFFFSFGNILQIIQQNISEANNNYFKNIFLVIWSSFFIILALPSFWKFIRNPKNVTIFLNLVLALALCQTLIHFFQEFKKAGGNFHFEFTSPLPPQEHISLSDQNTPDIYIIIVDGYAREDVLDKIYQYNNAPFINFLLQNGFYIANQSHSNYNKTYQSIGSLLNFDYLTNWNPPSNPFWSTSYFKKPILENRVFHLLHEIGYRVIVFENVYWNENTEWKKSPDIDMFLSYSSIKLNRIEQLLLAQTPIELFSNYLNIPLYNYQSHEERILYTFNYLEQVSVTPGPKIVFAHILAPHPPFVFDDHGNSIQPNKPYSIDDGNDFNGTNLEYISGYKDQLIFINTLLEKSINNILEKSIIKPIIILQADHGPGAFLQWDDPAKSCIWERTSILNAYYFPQKLYSGLYQTISPVNTFRLIFNTYFGTQLSLLEDKIYFFRRNDKEMIDITNNADSTLNCPIK